MFIGWHSHDNRTNSRKPNFTSSEIRCLIALYDHNKSKLQNEGNDTPNMTDQNDIWKGIAKAVSETGTKRTATECLQKWMKFLLQAKKEENMENEEAEKGGSFPKSQFTDLILRVDRTKEQVVENAELADEFWDSLEDNTADIILSNEAIGLELMKFMDDEDTSAGTMCDDGGSADGNGDGVETAHDTTNGHVDGKLGICWFPVSLVS